MSALMETFIVRLRMVLAEAGYPDAHVYEEWSGVFIEGVPEDVQQKAVDVVNGPGTWGTVER